MSKTTCSEQIFYIASQAEMLNADTKLYIDSYTNSKKPNDETTPWAKFREQIVLWEEEGLKELAAKFPNQAVEKTSMGDASIIILGWHYH
ncbi:MAG: hypothetical protein V7K25_07600 [Nostoc sp.]|uniref:hypothetical protein n=1 Tax=Nostoc sp. TaxID=1180 RepID=UPI002FF69887